ncbi:MAG: hypothetical protein ABR536_00410, partial [Solirubrobacterales bacterium]
SASHSQLTFFDASNEQDGTRGGPALVHSLDELKALGVDVVRLQVSWRFVAPNPDSSTRPAGFDPRNQNTYGTAGANWGSIDAVVRGATARGMKVSLVLSGSPPTGMVPRWASRDPSGSQSDPDPKAFEDFAYAVGQRYGGAKGSVGLAQYISIWNEPNSRVFLRAGRGQGGAAVALLYRRLVIAGQAGLKAAGWPGTLLIGELGPTPPGKLSRPIPFLSRVLCLRKGRLGKGCEKLDVGGVAHHPYSFRRAPFEAALNSGQISIGNLGLLQRLLNRARRAGAISSGAQLYNTEYGYPSRPDISTGVPRRQQAEFNSIAEYLTYRMPGVASYAQYLMRDDPRGSLAGGFTSGLCPPGAPDTVYAHGKGCKPAFGAFRTALVVRSRKVAQCSGATRAGCLAATQSGPVTVWGHIRPATGVTTAQIVVRNPGAKHAVPLRTVRTDASGYFQFRARTKSGRLWSVIWNGFGGPFVRPYAF